MLNKSLVASSCEVATLCGISNRFQLLSPKQRQVAHALLTRPPLIRGPKSSSPFDLNVLGTPPAFILSQDQTLDKWYLNLRRELKSIDRVLLSSLLFLLIKRNCTRSFFTLSSSISLDFLCFVLSHLLFNFQGPLPLVFVRIASFLEN